MKIKEQFLNEKSLKPYGFKKKTIDVKRNICEYRPQKNENLQT